LKKTLELFDNIAIAFSGAEDMAVNHRKHIQVFCLETGRLHPETYRFIEKIRNHYRIDIEILSPDKDLLDSLVKKKGLFSFYVDAIMNVAASSLKRKQPQLDARITGQRKDQSPDNHSLFLKCK